MRTQGLIVIATLAAFGCAGKLSEVVRLQAARDLECPADQVEVFDRRSDNYVRDYTVVACGKTAHYQAACNMTETCVAYQPRQTGQDAAASEALTAGVDAVPTSEPEAPPEEVPGQWNVVETVRPKPPPAPPPATVIEFDAGPPGSQITVELHNTCGETVALFLGEDPKGSGQRMSLASTNMTTLRAAPGTKLWLLDRDGNGAAGVTMAPGMRAVEASCAGLSAR